MTELHLDVANLIVELLDLQSIARLSQTCRFWNKICSNETVWRREYLREFGEPFGGLDFASFSENKRKNLLQSSQRAFGAKYKHWKDWTTGTFTQYKFPCSIFSWDAVWFDEEEMFFTTEKEVFRFSLELKRVVKSFPLASVVSLRCYDDVLVCIKEQSTKSHWGTIVKLDKKTMTPIGDEIQLKRNTIKKQDSHIVSHFTIQNTQIISYLFRPNKQMITRLSDCYDAQRNSITVGLIWDLTPIFNQKHPTLLKTIEEKRPQYSSVQFMKEQPYYMKTMNFKLTFFDINRRKPSFVVSVERQSIELQMTNDCQFIISPSYRKMDIFSIAENKILLTIPTEQYHGVFTFDEWKLASFRYDNSLSLWDIRTGKSIPNKIKKDGSFSPQMMKLIENRLVALSQAEICIWECRK